MSLLDQKTTATAPNVAGRDASTLRQYVALAVLVAVTFAPIAGAEFVRFDDAFTLHRNPRLNPPSWQNLGAYWHEWRTGEMGLYVPVTDTVWMGLAWAGRVSEPDPEGSFLNPWIFHATSVVCHIAGAIVAFALLKRLIRSKGDWAAWIGAAVWALHPVQVEPVAWASGLKDVLCGLFSLLAIWNYVRAAQAEDSHTSRARWAYALSLVFLLIAILSKPSAMMVGSLCLIIDVLVIKRPPRTALRSVWPMFLLALPLALLARHVQTVTDHYIPPIWSRPLIAADALFFYVRQILLPLHLSLDYGRMPQLIVARPMVYAIALVPLALLVLALWKIRQPTLWAAAMLFVAALLPILGLTVFEFQFCSTTADHYLYVAMLGPALAVAWAMGRWPSKPVLCVAFIVILAMSAKSFAQARIWHDDFTLFPHVLSVNPNSFIVHNNLGTAYRQLGVREGAEADAAGMHGDFAAVRLHREKQTQAWQEAVEHFATAFRLNAAYYEAYRNFATVSRWLGRDEQAGAALREMVKVHLSDLAHQPEAYRSKLLKLAHDANGRGQYFEAEQCARLGLELKPDDPEALKELATARAGDKAATQPAGL